MSFAIQHQLPQWLPGFTAWWAMQVLDGMARGYAPWATVKRLPPLYGGTIVYRPDAKHGSGVERFHNPWQVVERGVADCNDAVLYRLVELYLASERPTLDRTRADWAGGEIHVLIRRANGVQEDPSLILLELEKRYGRKR
jgi:hypothetical protein